MSNAPEWLQDVEQAHQEGEKSRYLMLRISERRWGILTFAGGTSVTSVDGEYVGYRHVDFVEGYERLPFEQARTAIAHLLRTEKNA